MIGSVATSRRANAFAQSLDEQQLDGNRAADQASGDASSGPDSPEETAGAPGAPPEDRADDGTDSASAQFPLLALAERLTRVPGPELDPDVKTVQRARLMAAMETSVAEEAASGRNESRPVAGRLRSASRLAKGLTAGGLGVGVAASAFGCAAAASDGALPGESLYGVKRSVEDLRLDLTGGEADRGRVHLDHASTRLQEARRLMERARSGELDHESLGEIRKALSGMHADAVEGHRLLHAVYARDGDIAPMRSLSSFSRSHRDSWSSLKGRLPVQLGDVRDEVSSVFDAMESDVGPVLDLPQDAPPETGPRPGGAPESAPARQPSPSRGDGAAEDGRSGEPAPSGEEEHDGLLGGNGLLDPAPGADERTGGIEGGAGLPEPPDADVTLPPLVPEVLPGLNELSGDGKTR